MVSVLYILVGLAAGIFGGYLGAQLIHNVSDPWLKRGFGVFLLVVALKMIVGK